MALGFIFIEYAAFVVIVLANMILIKIIKKLFFPLPYVILWHIN